MRGVQEGVLERRRNVYWKGDRKSRKVITNYESMVRENRKPRREGRRPGHQKIEVAQEKSKFV
jgi:hypothetical protein